MSARKSPKGSPESIDERVAIGHVLCLAQVVAQKIEHPIALVGVADRQIAGRLDPQIEVCKGGVRWCFTMAIACSPRVTPNKPTSALSGGADDWTWRSDLQLERKHGRRQQAFETESTALCLRECGTFVEARVVQPIITGKPLRSHFG
jgi:hypothetical protein